MSWDEGERATVIGGVILAALALVCYIGLVHAAWNFATLTTPDHRPMAPDFANYWSERSCRYPENQPRPMILTSFPRCSNRSLGIIAII